MWRNRVSVTREKSSRVHRRFTQRQKRRQVCVVGGTVIQQRRDPVPYTTLLLYIPFPPLLLLLPIKCVTEDQWSLRVFSLQRSCRQMGREHGASTPKKNCKTNFTCMHLKNTRENTMLYGTAWLLLWPLVESRRDARWTTRGSRCHF